MNTYIQHMLSASQIEQFEHASSAHVVMAQIRLVRVEDKYIYGKNPHSCGKHAGVCGTQLGVRVAQVQASQYKRCMRRKCPVYNPMAARRASVQKGRELLHTSLYLCDSLYFAALACFAACDKKVSGLSKLWAVVPIYNGCASQNL